MYIPRANQEDRIPVLHKLMEDQPFASLITMGSSGLFASHIPMVLEQNGAMGQLRGHISRANTQWRDYTPSVEALAIFSGPQHYITPNWYPEKRETGKVVPTWNYVVVHAYGYLKIIEDREWLMAHLANLTNIHEAESIVSWKMGGCASGLYCFAGEGYRRSRDDRRTSRRQVEGQPESFRAGSQRSGEGFGRVEHDGKSGDESSGRGAGLTCGAIPEESR